MSTIRAIRVYGRRLGLQSHCHANCLRFFASITASELDMIRAQIEDFDTIEAVDPEIRAIVKRNWPNLLSKLPPEEDA